LGLSTKRPSQVVLSCEGEKAKGFEGDRSVAQRIRAACGPHESRLERLFRWLTI